MENDRRPRGKRQNKRTLDNKISQTVQRSRLRPLCRVRDCCFYLQFNQDHGKRNVPETLTRDTHIIELESGQLRKCFGLQGRHVVRKLVGGLRGYREGFEDLCCFCEFPFLYDRLSVTMRSVSGRCK